MAPPLDAPTPARDALFAAQVTQGPSPAALDLRLNTLQRRVSFPCATGCIYSAVTNLTPCQTADLACQCEQGNAQAIEGDAFACIESRCGAITAEAVFSLASAYCMSVDASQLDSLTSDNLSTYLPGGNSVVVVTQTSANGQVRTSTVFANPTGGSSSSSGSSGSSGSGSSGSGSSGSGSGGSGSSGSGTSTSDTGSGSGLNLSSSGSSSLSTGAIVGIAVGSAAAVALLCAIAFLIYRYNRKKRYDAVPVTEAKDTPGAAAPGAAAAAVAPGAPLPGQPELDSKTAAYVHNHPQQQPAISPLATSSPIDQSTVSRHPSVVSNVSPAPPHAQPFAPPPTVPELQHNTPWQQPGVPELHPSTAWQQPPQPGVPELQPNTWQQQQYPGQPQQQPTPPPGYALHHPGQPPQATQPSRHEMGVMPPELQPNAAQFVPELPQHHAQQPYAGYQAGVYEMPGGPGAPGGTGAHGQ